MLNDLKAIKGNKKDFRNFGLIMAVVCSIIGAVLLFKDKDNFHFFFIAAATLALIAFIVPAALKHPYKAWMILAFILNRIMTTIILTLLFYVVFTITGMLMKLFGKNPLSKKSPDTKSFWIEKPKDKETDYECQY